MQSSSLDTDISPETQLKADRYEIAFSQRYGDQSVERRVYIFVALIHLFAPNMIAEQHISFAYLEID